MTKTKKFKLFSIGKLTKQGQVTPSFLTQTSPTSIHFSRKEATTEGQEWYEARTEGFGLAEGNQGEEVGFCWILGVFIIMFFFSHFFPLWFGLPWP